MVEWIIIGLFAVSASAATLAFSTGRIWGTLIEPAKKTEAFITIISWGSTGLLWLYFIGYILWS